MAIRFQDKHICPHCSREFCWAFIQPEKDEFIPLLYDRDIRNVKNCTELIVPNQYRIELE